MLREKLKLICLDASWIVLAFLITWSLATGYFPSRYRDLPRETYWWMGVVSALGLFGSIVIHEFAHAVVARRRGLPMKGITLFIFGGVAEMGGEPADAGTEFMMAIVGPIASAVLGCLAFAIYYMERDVWPAQITGVLEYLSWINWTLAAFNLIPAFPLDGGRVLRSAIWHWNGNLTRATQIAARIGSGFGAVLMALALLQLFSGNVLSAIWWFLIGMFLRGAAQASYQQVVIRGALEGEPIRRFMKTDLITVPPNISIEDLIEHYVYKHHHRMFPVVTGSDHLAGCITTDQVKSIPRDEWNRHSVQELVQPCSMENTVSPETDAITALSKMRNSGISRLLVVDKDRLVAIVALKDLLDFISLKMDLQGDSTFSPGHV